MSGRPTRPRPVGVPARRAMVGAAVVLLTSLVMASLMVAAAPGTTDAAPAPVEALLIGDSVLDGLAQGYGAPGRAALAARHSFILDTAGCRRLITTSCRIPPKPAPPNALTVLRSHAGQFDRAVVVAAGYNDSSTGAFGIDAAVDAVIAEAHRQGIDHVVWLTYREAGTLGNINRFRQSNATLRRRTDPELHIADWAVASASMPPSWFSGDGIHIGGQAATAMADLIGDALDELLPARCRSGIWSGSPPPAEVATVSSAVAGGLQLTPSPVRVLDTRTMPGKLGAGMVLSVPIAGLYGVHSDAFAAVVSVTAVEPCADTFLTVYPCGNAPPLASAVNAPALSVVANSAVVRLGGGALCVYTSRATDVLVDLSGWISNNARGTVAVSPVRIVDTRAGQRQALTVAQHRVPAGGSMTIDLGEWPTASGATAATMNVTAAAPLGAGFVSVLPGPCASAALPPATSNLNVAGGRDVAASTTVGLDDGQACIFASVDTDIVVDLQALHGGVTGELRVVDPSRIADTRSTRRLTAGQSLPVDLGLGTPVLAAVVNLTAVDPSGSGFLTLYPCGSGLPTASNLNVVAGAVIANRAIVSTGGTPRFCLYTSVDTDAVVDLEGYIAAS